MKTIHITLAADKSLKQEQMELADLVENLNYSLSSRGTNILMVVWDCSSKHDEGTFREKVADTDLCLNLYYETFNDSSLSDLDAAFQSFCEGKNPKKIYVYFKDSDEIPENLREFRDSFPTRYGHFYCSFSNIDTLKADFLLQFIEYHANTLDGNRLVDINNGKITIDGKEYVNLRNVPFAGNNEEYNRLIRDIKKTRKLLAVTDMEDEDYMTYAKDLDDLLKIQQQMEKSLWETAMLITKLCTQQCSERLERAMKLFQSGDNKGANALLDEDAIDHDVQQNKRMIQLGKEAHKALLININEYRLKIKATQSEMAPGWSDKVIALYEKTIDVAEGEIEECLFADLLFDYSGFIWNQKLYYLLDGLYEKVLVIYRKFALVSPSMYNKSKVALALHNLALFHCKKDLFVEAEEELQEALSIFRQLADFESEVFLYHVAGSLSSLASLHRLINKHGISENEYKEALTINQYLAKSNPNTYIPEVSKVLVNLGDLHRSIGNYSEAEKEEQEAISIVRQLAEATPKQYLSYLATCLTNIAALHLDIHCYNDAEKEFQEALSIQRRFAEINPNEYYPEIAKVLVNLANLHSDTKVYEKAELEYQEALSFYEQLSKNNPELYLSDVALCLNNLSTLYCDAGKYTKAEELCRKALSIRRNLAEKTPSVYLPFVASSLFNLSGLHSDTRQFDEAEKELKEALQIYLQFEKETSGAYLKDIIMCISNLAVNNHYAGKLGDAEKYYLDVLTLYRQLAQTHASYLPNVAMALYNLGNMHSDYEKYTEAESEYRESLHIYRHLVARGSDSYISDVAKSLYELGNIYCINERYIEAEKVYQESLGIYRKLTKINSNAYVPIVAFILYNLAAIHQKNTNCLLDAKNEMQESLAIYRQLVSDNPEQYNIYVARLLNGLAWGCYLDKDFTSALNLVTESISILKESYNLDTLACIYKASGWYEDALYTFEECLSEKINEGASQESIKETQDKTIVR